MTDPIYTYRKTIGWVPETSGTILKLKDATVRMEFREPRVGEYYDSCDLSNPKYVNEDGTPKLENWLANYTNNNSCNLADMCGPWLDGWDPGSGSFYVVFIKV